MELLNGVLGWFSDVAQIASGLTIEDVLANKVARALGMLVLVLITIWTIALVYSGYARDSDLGPVAIRPHTNKRLGDGTIVFDQSMYPFQMDGVEATCRVYYQYEDREGRLRKIALGKPKTLRMHIRVSQIPRDASTVFGFETHDEIGQLPQGSVQYPTFEQQVIPDLIERTPATVAEYVAANQLEPQWTEDDDAPVVSLGPGQMDLITEARKEFILSRAHRWRTLQESKFAMPGAKAAAAKNRANVFGSYYIKMQFSKNPQFVLFKHPNKELKMTAWLTLLTSFFSIAMDLWPVDGPTASRRTTPPPSIEVSYGPAQIASQTRP